MFFKKKYKISAGEWNEFNPEEALHDAGSSYNKVELPISQRVFTVFFGLVALGVIFYLTTIFKLQILEGRQYLEVLSSNNSLKYFSVPIRGIIYDRQGKPLVENIPVFSLVALTNELNRQTPEQLVKTIDTLAALIGQPSETIAAQYRDNKNKAALFYVKTDLAKDELLRIKTASLPGFYIIYDAVRNYPEGPSMAHAIGYTAKVGDADIKKDPSYKPTDRIGRYGLEAQYETWLRGNSNRLLLNDDLQGSGNLQSGNNLHTNLDEAVQKQLYQAFVDNGIRRGAAIAQDPQTGAVLALVSIPSFDNNIFEKGENDKIAKVLNNNAQPLFDRVISGKYSPGSTIKPLLALAGLKEKVVTPQTIINATGSITVPSIYDPKIVYTFNDWKVHGLTDLKKAIAWSVDVYFYALGGGYGNIKGLGVEKETKYLQSMLADQPTGIDLPGEISGFVPTPDWKQKTKHEPWFIGDTYNISIGQGDLGVTPLWINSYISSIANGGKIMKPYLVNKISDSSGKTLQDISPQILSEIPFDPGTIEIVKQGMRQTITDGTASLLQDLPVPVAAKTGTAQVVGLHNLNSLFTVFGPYDAPTINLTVLVEDIHGSQGLAIRVANSFLKWYFGQPK